MARLTAPLRRASGSPSLSLGRLAALHAMSFLKRFRRGDGATQQTSSITPVDPATLGFGVGDVVRDVWRNEHMVTEIDPLAEHGLGLIETRRINDGVVLYSAMMAHGLTFVRHGGGS